MILQMGQGPKLAAYSTLKFWSVLGRGRSVFSDQGAAGHKMGSLPASLACAAIAPLMGIQFDFLTGAQTFWESRALSTMLMEHVMSCCKCQRHTILHAIQRWSLV